MTLSMKICVGSMSVFFRDIPLLLQGGLLTLKTNETIQSPPNQKEPTLLWVGSLLLEDSWTAENGYYRCCQEKNVDTKP